MDTYKLINSKAISEHCRKIEHKFNTEELAVLIYRNKSMDIEEKINLYQELINDYPDMEVIKRINCKHYDSVKDMISGEIQRLQDRKKEMLVQDENMIYTMETLYKNSQEFEESNNFYKTYEAVCNSINEWRKECKQYEDLEIVMYKIVKRSFIRDERRIIEEYIINKKNQAKLIDIKDTNEFLDIDNICLNIPTPFKEGDILAMPTTNPYSYGETKIFVLEELCNWREGFQQQLDKGEHDSSDMVGTGYSLLHGEDLWWDWYFGYDSFEYFECKLEGKQRILKAISSLMKNEIGPDLLLEAYKYIMTEEVLKETFEHGYTDAGLECAGLSKEDIKKIKGN